jgi:hypothetical protein
MGAVFHAEYPEEVRQAISRLTTTTIYSCPDKTGIPRSQVIYTVTLVRFNY